MYLNFFSTTIENSMDSGLDQTLSLLIIMSVLWAVFQDLWNIFVSAMEALVPEMITEVPWKVWST